MNEWKLADPQVVEGFVSDDVDNFGRVAPAAARPKARGKKWPRYAKAVLVFTAVALYEAVIFFVAAKDDLLAGLVSFGVMFLIMTVVFLLITGIASFSRRLH